MRERDGHESVSSPAFDVHRPGARDRVIRAREWDLVDDDQATRLPSHVHALPQGHRAHQTRVAFVPETLDQLRERLLPLEVDRQLGTLAQRLRPRLSTPARGEEREDPAPRGLGEFHELIQKLVGGPLTPGQRQVGGHVADALAGVVEGRAHVDAVPGNARHGHPSGRCHEVEVSPEGEGRRCQDRSPLTDAYPADRPRHVEGPHRQAGIVGLILRNVGDRLIGVASPRVQCADQLIDGRAGEELGGGFALGVGHLMAGAPGRAIQHDHRIHECARPVLQEPLLQGCHRRTQAGPGLVQVRGIDRQIRAQGARHAAHAPHRQVGGRLGAHAVGQLVGLVDNDGIVLAEKLALPARVDTEQGVVRDDNVRVRGFHASRLREALVNERAVLAQALGLRHRRMVPGAVRHAGDQIVAVPRRGLADPLADAQDFLAELARRAGSDVPVFEQGALRGVPAVQLVHAGVVRPALEYRDLQAHARRRGDRVDGHRRILDEDLALQRKRRRRDEPTHTAHRAVRQQGYQVAQRLARTRARLHQQVLAGLQGGGPLGDHRCLPLTRGPAHRGDDRVEDAPRGLDQVLAHCPLTAASPTVPPTAARAITAASASSTRATMRVPVSTYSSRSTSPSSWILCTREPAEYGRTASTATRGRGSISSSATRSASTPHPV